MELHTLRPPKGKIKKIKRIGRGESSGQGKTSGKGGKGQTARSGASIPAQFEGGQMPLYRRIPKIGFKSRVGILGLNDYQEVTTGFLNRFDEGTIVDVEKLLENGFSHHRKKRMGFKVICKGDITKRITVKLNAVTEGAKKAIEAKGGTFEVV